MAKPDIFEMWSNSNRSLAIRTIVERLDGIEDGIETQTRYFAAIVERVVRIDGWIQTWGIDKPQEFIAALNKQICYGQLPALISAIQKRLKDIEDKASRPVDLGTALDVLAGRIEALENPLVAFDYGPPVEFKDAQPPMYRHRPAGITERVTEWRVAYRVKPPSGVTTQAWRYKTWLTEKPARDYYDWMCNGGTLFDHEGHDYHSIEPTAVRLSSRQVERHPWFDHDQWQDG